MNKRYGALLAGILLFGLTNVALAADTTPPVVNITGPDADVVVSGNVPLAAIASDNVGVVGVQFVLDQSTNIGAEAMTSPYTGSWDSTTVSSGLHTLSARARDTARNSATSIINVIVDNQAPTGSIVINNNDVVTSTSTVNLTLSASDALTSVTEMRISNTTTFGSSQPFATTTSWTLSPGGGTKTVYAQFKDAAGNWSSTVSDTITLDVSVPGAATLGAHALSWLPCSSNGPLTTSPVTTQANGSTILAWIARGNSADFTTGTIPTDTYGNTYSMIGSVNDYGPLWPGSGEAMYAVNFANGGAGHSVTTPLIHQDEATLAMIEVKNGGIIRDAKFNKVLNGDPNTSLDVTTTGPATLIAVWAGDGAANNMTATPNNGFTVIDSQLINTTCAVQAVIASREVSAAGTYNVTWTATPAQGAHLWLIAVETGTPPVPDTTAPSTPTNLAANVISTSQINLSWTASTDDVAVAGYKVFRDGTQIATTTLTSFSNTGLNASTTYSYTVKAYDAAGNVSGGATVQATTQSNPADTTPPVITITAPSGTLPAGTVSTLLSATTNEAASCSYSTTAGTAFTSMTPFTTTGNTSHSTTLTGLTNGSSYTYYVKCRDASLNVSADSSRSFSVASSTQQGGLVRTDLKNQLITETKNSPISVTTSSFTPPSNSLLVASVLVVNDKSSGTITVTGGGLTWTRRQTFTSPNSPGGYTFKQEVWTAPVTTGAPMTITVNGSGTTGADPARVNIQAVAFTGYNTASPIGAMANGSNLGMGAATINLSAAPAASSVVFATRGIADNNTVNSTATPGSGWTEVYDQATSAGYGDLESMVRTNSTSPAVTWNDLADPSSASLWESNAFALEIKSAN